MFVPHFISRMVVASATLLTSGLQLVADDVKSPPQPTEVTTVAVLPFQERGHDADQSASQVTDLLFAELATAPDLFLVEREAIETLHQEQALNLTGLVGPGQAVQVGHLTGAKVIVTGSVVVTGKQRYVIAKIIGTETSRVLGASVKGPIDGELDELVTELATSVAGTVSKRSKDLIAPPAPRENQIAELAKRLRKDKKPAVWIDVTEQHVGEPTVDPAVETELAYICSELGCTVIDKKIGKQSEADVHLTGDGLSQFAGRHGDLSSAKARVELKAVDARSGEVIAVDRQVSIQVDLADQLAAKSALQAATAELAKRMLPTIVRRHND